MTDDGGEAKRLIRSSEVPSRRRTVRWRVLAMMLAFMVAGLAAAGTVTYTSQFGELGDRVDRELRQEIDELELIAQQTVQESPGEAGVDKVLRQATGSIVPSEHESVIALVDGSPRYQPEGISFSLSAQSVLEQIRAAYTPERTVYVDLVADEGTMRAAVSSVAVVGDDREGIFVVANRITAQRDAIWKSAGVYAATSIAVLLAAAVAGYLLSGRLLRPLGELREATESITPDDLDVRVAVPDADDDVTALARTFNTMLDRISEGFEEQRRFMSDVSHELRTPLTIIRGTVETTDAHDPEDVLESHQIALEEVERMNQLVGDLSTLAKARRPDFIRPAPMNLELVGPRALSRIEHLGPRIWEIDADATGTVLADPDRLMQAVVQLAANAVRFSEEGSRIRLRVTTIGRRPRPGSEQSTSRSFLISLRDEGAGIPAHLHDRIFERFVQADSGHSGSGSGLGLSIVRAIAEGHGGRVHLDSQPGVGSEFSLILPFIEVPPVPQSRPGLPAASHHSPPSHQQTAAYQTHASDAAVPPRPIHSPPTRRHS